MSGSAPSKVLAMEHLLPYSIHLEINRRPCYHEAVKGATDRRLDPYHKELKAIASNLC